MEIPKFEIPKIDFTAFSKQEQQKLIAAGVVLLLGIAGSYFFLFAPGWAKLSAMKKETVEWNTKAQEAESLLAQKQSIEQMAKEYAACLKTLPQWIPEEGDSSWILRLVGEVENSQKVRTVAIKPLDSKEVEKESKDYGGNALKEGANYKWAICQIELKTDYHSLGKFIDDLERKNPCLKVSSLNVKGAADDTARHSAIVRVQYPISKKHVTPPK